MKKVIILMILAVIIFGSMSFAVPNISNIIVKPDTEADFNEAKEEIDILGLAMDLFIPITIRIAFAVYIASALQKIMQSYQVANSQAKREGTSFKVANWITADVFGHIVAMIIIILIIYTPIFDQIMAWIKAGLN